MNKERVRYIDFLKGIAIFLVVWGHSLQYASDSSYFFFDNIVFKIIYAFHMPLFMLLSGLFFEKSISMSFGIMVKKRYLQWVFPATVFSALIIGIPALLRYDSNTLEILFNSVLYPRTYWYVVSLLFCLVWAALFYKLLKERLIIAAIISTITILSLPDASYLLTPYNKFMLPYFWLGAIINRYALAFTKKQELIIIATSTLLFILVFLLQGKQPFIYSTPFSSLNMGICPFNLTATNKFDLGNIATLYSLGLFGSVATFFALKNIFGYIKFSVVARCTIHIGNATLGIYFISVLVNFYVSRFISFRSDTWWMYDFIYTPAYSILTILFCMITIAAIKKSAVLSRILLGI